MTRLLFLTPYPPSRIRVRSYGFVSHLMKEHSVTVLALCAGKREEEDALALQREGFNIITVQEKRNVQFLRGLRAFASQLPLQVAFCASPGLGIALNELLDSGQFDLLHIEFIRALGVVPEHLPIPAVWDAVDCTSQLYEKGAYFGATLMIRFIGRREARLTRSYELKQLQRFRHVLVTSERDRQALLDVGDELETADRRSLAEVTVLPHGVDQQYFQPYTGPRKPGTLVFSGKMSFHANVAGVLTFVKYILPHIWKQRPDIKLIIAGSDPPLSIRRLGHDPRIEVTGYVPDLRPYIAQAQVSVCSLPYAVGIQNKVLEAMALGTPVVATLSAVAGMQTVAGQDLLVADTPEAFATAVLRVLDDHSLWNNLSKCGLSYITAHHNWEDILKRLMLVYTLAMS